MVVGSNYIDFSTSVVFITFNCYEPSEDRFITSQMIFEFMKSGVIKAHPIKIITFALDQMKQNSQSAMLIDFVQAFFCLCYVTRAIYVKILEKGWKRKKDEKGNEIEPEGYSKCCSLSTDFLVIVSFSAKFFYSIQTNYHDIDSLLNDNYMA